MSGVQCGPAQGIKISNAGLIFFRASPNEVIAEARIRSMPVWTVDLLHSALAKVEMLLFRLGVADQHG